MKKYLIYLFQLIISVSLIIWAFSGIEFSSTLNFILDLSKMKMGLVFVLAIIGYVINFYYYLFTLKESKLKYSTKNVIKSFFIGYVLRLTIPGGYGEAGKLLLIEGKIKNKFSSYSLKLVAEFLLLLFLLGFAITAIFPARKYLLFFSIIPIILILLVPILRKIKYVDLLLIPNVKYKKIVFVNSLFALFIYIVFILQYQVILWDYNIAFFEIVAICIVILSVIGIPISIAGIGVRENVSVYLLAMYGISENIAITIPMIVFAINILIPAFIGAVILLFGTNRNIFSQKL